MTKIINIQIHIEDAKLVEKALSDYRHILHDSPEDNHDERVAIITVERIVSAALYAANMEAKQEAVDAAYQERIAHYRDNKAK